MVLFKLGRTRNFATVVYHLHSNMVLFKSPAPARAWCLVPGFTFQYGSIQMKTRNSTFLRVTNLHSNMVLFKYTQQILICLDILFTFQYGSIQINTSIFFNRCGRTFTFQYGSIQI